MRIDAEFAQLEKYYDEMAEISDLTQLKCRPYEILENVSWCHVAKFQFFEAIDFRILLTEIAST